MQTVGSEKDVLRSTKCEGDVENGLNRSITIDTIGADGRK